MGDHSWFLESERLAWRVWKSEDKNLALRLWKDPVVTKLFGARPQIPHDEVLQRLEDEIEMQKIHGVQYWPIFDKSTNEYVGAAGLRISDGVFELGFHFRPCMWGKGLATEAGKKVVEYAFNVLDAKVIYAGHHPDNLASKKVLLKIGFIDSTREFSQTVCECGATDHPCYEIRPTL